MDHKENISVLTHAFFWFLYMTGKLSMLVILKHRGHLDLPMNNKGSLIEPVTFAQAFTVIRS